jgi:hypothetical protein
MRREKFSPINAKGKSAAFDAANFVAAAHGRQQCWEYLLKHPVTGIADLAADPIEIWTTIREAYSEKREERRPESAPSSWIA